MKKHLLAVVVLFCVTVAFGSEKQPEVFKSKTMAVVSDPTYQQIMDYLNQNYPDLRFNNYVSVNRTDPNGRRRVYATIGFCNTSTGEWGIMTISQQYFLGIPIGPVQYTTQILGTGCNNNPN